MMSRARVRSLVGLVAALVVSGCASTEEGIAGDAGASACGSCHTTEYAAWSSSRLAASGTSPVFEALSTSAGTAWGEPAKARCVSCHQPGFGGDHGIGCVSCHAATGNLATRDGLLTVDTAAPVNGPFDDPVATPAHGSQSSPLLESSDLCGTCHQVTGPGLLHETTLDELNASKVASEGATCVTCHMPPLTPGPIALGQTNTRARSDHSFVGFDPPWGAPASEQTTAAARTLQLLQLGLTLFATRRADGIDVTVVNRAGHAVPTGVTFLRSVWVDVVLTDAAGASAKLASVVSLGAQPTLEGAPVALITEADTVEPHELASGQSITVHVATPTSLIEPVVAVVTLQGRAVRPEVLGALGLTAMAAEVPTHVIQTVRIDE